MAPFKNNSLPTLELLGVFLAHKCLPSILSSLESVKFRNVYIAIDAQVVLTWVLTKATSTGNTFQNNRLSDIATFEKQVKEEFNLPINYRYVATKDNPSDLLTRGLSTKQFKNKLNFWLNGPEWLCRSPVIFPDSRLLCLSPENKKVVACCSGLSGHDTPAPIVPFGRFTSLNKLLRVTQLCFKFISRLKKEDNDGVQSAKIYLIKFMQHQSFREELSFLANPQRASRPDRVDQLGLFLDPHRIIHCNGRLGKVDAFSWEVKNPILLARNHPFTELIIKHLHGTVRHMAAPSTVNKIRASGFWIPNPKKFATCMF